MLEVLKMTFLFSTKHHIRKKKHGDLCLFFYTNTQPLLLQPHLKITDLKERVKHLKICTYILDKVTRY